jgi:hypothetical protein
MKMTTRSARYKPGGDYTMSPATRAWKVPGTLLLGAFSLYARIDQWFLRRKREREERDLRWAAQEQASIDAANLDAEHGGS